MTVQTFTEHLPLNPSEKQQFRMITVWQPWATFLALGIKNIETRPKRWGFRGRVVIHAGKQWNSDQHSYTKSLIRGLSRRYEDLYWQWDRLIDFDWEATLGRVLCVRDMVGCDRLPIKGTSRLEIDLGNHDSGRHGYRFTNTVALEKPLAAKGQQGPKNLVKSDPGLLAAILKDRSVSENLT